MSRKALIRLLSDGASVEDDDVRLLLLDRFTEPELFEHAFDPLRVVSVHLAAERRDEVALHGALNSVGGKCRGSGTLASHPCANFRGSLVAGRGHGVPLVTLLWVLLGFAGAQGDCYFANSIARDSRITVTLIWPGYSRRSSMSRAISYESSAAWSSSISAGLTITRISRPA